MPPQSAKMSLQGRREYHATLQSATRPTSGENREPRDTRTTTQNPGYSVYRGDPRNTGRTTTLARKPRHATSSAVEASCYEKCCMCACCPFGGGLSNKQETAEPTDRETVVRDSDFVVSADGMQYADEADDLESARRNKKKRNMTNYGTLVFEGADGEQRSTTNKSTNKSGLIFGAGSSSTTSKNYGNATFSGENSSLVGAPVQVKTSVESEGLDDVAEQLLQWRREQAKPRAHLSASSDTDHYSNFAPMKMSHIEDHEEEDNQVDAGGSGSSLLEFDGEDDDDENDVQPPGDDLDHMEKQFREFQLHHHQLKEEVDVGYCCSCC
ncbi:unnamed protein product [Amoebophrya sp. A25]|nr:unnamed protein product [Amoebophrya sp. A25]|eukprot:GSA25T00000927001.1